MPHTILQTYIQTYPDIMKNLPSELLGSGHPGCLSAELKNRLVTVGPLGPPVDLQHPLGSK